MTVINIYAMLQLWKFAKSLSILNGFFGQSKNVKKIKSI